MMKPTLLLSACAMLVSVAIGAPIDPIFPGSGCGNWALYAQEFSTLPELDEYKYVVNGISGSDGKAVFRRQAGELSADKTYLFSANLRECKLSHVFKQGQDWRDADNKTESIKTLYDLSLEVGLDPTYAKLFRSLPIARSQYSISGGNETVVVRNVGTGKRGRECVIAVGWECDGHFQLYDGDEVVAGMRFLKTFFPVSVNGKHLFQDFWTYE